MDIFESLENLNVSEECFDDIMDIVEEIVSTAQNNLDNAKNKEKKYVERIQKVVNAKKEKGALPDEKFADKVLNKLIDGKYRRNTEKAERLLNKAEKLPKSMDYMEKGGYQNLTKNEKGRIKYENRYHEPEKPSLGDPED